MLVCKLGTHTMRHSFRAWLDAVGLGVAAANKNSQSLADVFIRINDERVRQRGDE